MSLRRQIVIRCDTAGCDQRFTIGEPRGDVTRAASKLDGWVHHIARGERCLNRPAPSYDYCPACAAVRT